MHFTDLYLKNLTEPGYHWDSLPGFGVRIGKRRKTFVCVRAGKRTTIGIYPHQISLSEARRRALEILYGKPHTPIQKTVLEAIRAYLDAIEVRPGTKKFYEGHLSKLSAAFANKDISEITPRNCVDITRSHHTHTTLKAFFLWCKGKALITTNPLDNLRAPKKGRPRERTLTDDELRRVWIASGQFGRFGVIIRLCILTAQRRGEIAQIKSEYIRNDCLVIPAAVAKNGREHIVPLSQNSISLMTCATQYSTVYNAWSKPKANLDQLSNVTNWTIHDLRRTAASKMAQLGIQPHVIERVLNHAAPQSLGGTLGVTYNRHQYLDEMRQALQQYELEILRIVS